MSRAATLLKRLDGLAATVAAEIAAQPPDLLADLSPLDRAELTAWKSRHTINEQLVALMDGSHPLSDLLDNLGLPADCSDRDAQEAYQALASQPSPRIRRWNQHDQAS